MSQRILSGRTAELLIRTPEGIAFAQPLAGPLTRCLAWLVDAVLIGAAIVALSILLAVGGWLAPDVIQGVGTLAVFVVQIGFNALVT